MGNEDLSRILWNQHFTVFETNSTSLSQQVDVKLSFHCFWSGINISVVICSYEINILLFLKWNQRLWPFLLSWNPHFNLCNASDITTNKHLKTPLRQVIYLAYIAIISKRQNRQNRIILIFFYYTENHMQKFRHFWEKNSYKIVS